MQILTSCPACGSESVSSNNETEHFTYRAGGRDYGVHAVIPVWTCAACNESFLTDAGESARHRAICGAMNRLSPEDILALRQRVAMSRRAFGELSGIGEASLARWEAGELIQNESNDNLLRLLLIDENVRLLASLRGTTHVIVSDHDETIQPRSQRDAAAPIPVSSATVDFSRYAALPRDDEVRLAREARNFKLRRASGS